MDSGGVHLIKEGSRIGKGSNAVILAWKSHLSCGMVGGGGGESHLGRRDQLSQLESFWPGQGGILKSP
jgi:hypothetical protein